MGFSPLPSTLIREGNMSIYTLNPEFVIASINSPDAATL